MANAQDQQRRTTAASAAKAAAPVQRVNKEIDEKINAFIADNPELYQRFMSMTKEQLARKHMLRLMWKGEKLARGFDQLLEYAKQDPKLNAQVKRALDNEQHPLNTRQKIATRIINNHAAQQAIRATVGPKV